MKDRKVEKYRIAERLWEKANQIGVSPPFLALCISATVEFPEEKNWFIEELVVIQVYRYSKKDPGFIKDSDKHGYVQPVSDLEARYYLKYGGLKLVTQKDLELMKKGIREAKKLRTLYGTSPIRQIILEVCAEEIELYRAYIEENPDCKEWKIVL